MQRPGQLPRDFFVRDTLLVARGLLGQLLVRVEEGQRTTGIITETEAYIGTQDLGCHARSGRTARNAPMWGTAGHLYVYFTYGMHWMLNFVTENPGFPAAVLIRAMQPLEGLSLIRNRRAHKPDRILTDGPAKLCQALNITGALNGLDSCSTKADLFVEEMPADEERIIAAPRIGLNQVPEPWKSIPWRFLYKPPQAVLHCSPADSAGTAEEE